MPAANQPCDQPQRHQALEPNSSFIVQAPAGSGKTELLVQRYLVLLSQAHDPEEVVALTFTRKAAAEMRERILNSLQAVSEKEYTINTVSDYRYQLAKKLHQHQTCRGWDLLAQPYRLRIQTIDAFNAYLTCQMPIASRLGTAATVSETPESLYRLAVQTLLVSLTQQAPMTSALAQLLLHLDNDYSKAERLLIDMLTRRDQWLALLVHADLADLRNHLERNLAYIRSQLIDQLNTLPLDLRQVLLELINVIRQQCNQPTITLADHEDFWSASLSILLTEKNQWRKKMSIKHSLLATAYSQQYTQIVKRLKALLPNLSLEERWRVLLTQWRFAPPPTYTEAQWAILKALFQLLPHLITQLQQIFQDYHTVDYIEVALRALNALDNPQASTTLAARLDYPIKHILVDEFQDTSTIQLRLLTRLTAGWQTGDGHSLFLVGDPMQSIYRFRKAEVSLFDQVRQYGLGQLKLHALTLQCNFRSTVGIVNWVNTQFASLLSAPTHSLASVERSLIPSIAQSLNNPEPAVQWHWLIDANAKQEAHTIVTLVKMAIEQNPQGRIAILVRARNHLPTILMMLKQAKIPYHATAIDKLAEKSIIQDLLALTRALLHLADDIAWLAVLRAPWCGLSLQDLHSLMAPQESIHTTDAPAPEMTVWDRLLHLEQFALTPNARQRINRILPSLYRAIGQQGREPLVQRIKAAWLELGGFIYLEDGDADTDVQSFFKLLARLQVGEDIVDIEQLETELARLYANTTTALACPVEIMTIHKAKGLEFDTVILAGLHEAVRVDGPQLLLYKEQPHDIPPKLLFAPIKASYETEDSIYNYLQHEERQEAQQETIRLLYVATTRARSKLHLIACLQQDKQGHYKKPPANSFLAALWSILPPITPTPCAQPTPDTQSSASTTQWLKRLPLDWHDLKKSTVWAIAPSAGESKTNLSRQHSCRRADMQHSQAGLTVPAPQPIGYAGPDEIGIEVNADYSSDHSTYNPQRIVGSVLHRMLYQISREGLAAWPIEALAARQPHMRTLLLHMGLRPQDLPVTITIIQRALQRTLTDPRGRWILSNEHQTAESEYTLTACIEDKIQQIIIDRTFIDHNKIRWIIDYKTTVYDSDDSIRFLAEQKQQHRQQLEHYAKVLQLCDSHPIRLGLYFPLTALWQEWAFPPHSV